MIIETLSPLFFSFMDYICFITTVLFFLSLSYIILFIVKNYNHIKKIVNNHNEKKVKKNFTKKQKILIASIYITIIACTFLFLTFKLSNYQQEYKIKGTTICVENYSFMMLTSEKCPVKDIYEAPEICYMIHQARQRGINVSTKILENISRC